MAKLKTHKTSVKRFKITKTGKAVYSVKGYNHLKSKKDARVKNRKRSTRILDGVELRTLKKSIPGL